MQGPAPAHYPLKIAGAAFTADMGFQPLLHHGEKVVSGHRNRFRTVSVISIVNLSESLDCVAWHVSAGLRDARRQPPTNAGSVSGVFAESTRMSIR